MTHLTKEERKKRKQYLKTCKAYKKELKEVVKHYGPWDNFLPCFFKIQVEHWIDYYSLGYNVMAIEIKDTPEFEQPDRPTRLEIAKELKRLYDEWNDYISSGDNCIEERNVRKKAFFDYYMKYAQDMWD
jgi:hypothetical protein